MESDCIPGTPPGKRTSLPSRLRTLGTLAKVRARSLLNLPVKLVKPGNGDNPLAKCLARTFRAATSYLANPPSHVHNVTKCRDICSEESVRKRAYPAGRALLVTRRYSERRRSVSNWMSRGVFWKSFHRRRWSLPNCQ